MKSIMFTGVKGVGKSTLVERLSSSLGLPRCDYADFMVEAMGSASKDDIERLSAIHRPAVIRRVEQLLRDRHLFCDGENGFMLFENHLTVTNGGKIRLPLKEKYGQFNMAGLCILYAEPETILFRREGDCGIG